MNDIRKLYDELFERAAAIIATGEEHEQFIMTYKPSANGYACHGIISIPNVNKDRSAQVLRMTVSMAPEMWVVVHVIEAWARVAGADETLDFDRPVAEQPGAFECVIFTFYREGELWIARCPILRKPVNELQKGELEKVQPGDIEGRFIARHVR